MAADSFVEFLATDGAAVAVRASQITALRAAGEYSLRDFESTLVLSNGATIALKTTFETAYARLNQATEGT